MRNLMNVGRIFVIFLTKEMNTPATTDSLINMTGIVLLKKHAECIFYKK